MRNCQAISTSDCAILRGVGVVVSAWDLQFRFVFTDVCCLSHWHLMSAEGPLVVLMYISQVFTVLDIFLHAYRPFVCTFWSNLLPILKIGVSVFWVHWPLSNVYIGNVFSLIFSNFFLQTFSPNFPI